MYRNVTYKIDKDNNWQGMITLFTWDDDGNPMKLEFPHTSFLYYEDLNGSYSSIYGTKLKRMDFPNVAARRKFINNHECYKFYDVESPVREFLQNMFYKVNIEQDFMKFDLRTHFIDIEVSVDDEFPEPSKAKMPINLITVYDTVLKKYFSWGCVPQGYPKPDFNLDPEKIELNLYYNEKDLLSAYLSWYEKNYPDVISGWNSMFFDIPYLVNRIEKTLSEDDVLRLSPVKNVYTKLRMNKKYKEATYVIDGVSHMDYLILYRDKFKISPQFNFRLDTISQAENIGITKIKYDYTLKEFYNKYFERFVDYNIRDVEILVKLDAKLRLIKLARKLCNIGLVEYEAIYGSIGYIYNAIKVFQRKDEFLGFPALSLEKAPLGDQSAEDVAGYEGAYVKDPVVGVYKRGVAGVDLNSLYPNTLITLNLSPETKFGKITGMLDNNIFVKTTNNKELTLSKAQFEYLLKEKCIISENKVLYFKDNLKKGIVPRFLEWLYDERKTQKAIMLKKKREVSVMKEENKDEKLIAEFEEVIKVAEFNDRAYKGILNSVYGIMGTKFCPMYDIDLAESITLSGQRIIKEALDFTNKYFKEKYGEAEKDAAIYSDTDSIYFNCEALVNALIGPTGKFTKKNIEIITKELDHFVDDILNEYCYDGIVKPKFKSNLKRIKFSREKFATEGAFLTKKRYILHVKDEDGAAVDKFKYVGVDINKTEIPLKLRGFLKNIIEDSLIHNWNTATYHAKITEIWESFKQMPIEDISIHKGYSTEKETIGFLEIQKGGGIHAKAAIFYNQLIAKYHLDGKYEKIKVGDRLRYCYIKKDNEFNIPVIGFLYDYPEEFKELFAIDYKTMFNKTILSPLKWYSKVQNWREIDPSNEIIQNVLEL